MVYKISLCLLALIVSIIASSSINTGLLSHLYKKVASENRPLILVLDSNLKDRDDDNDDSPRVIKQNESDLDADRDIPLSLLDLLNQKRQPLKSEHRHPIHKQHLTDHRDSENTNKYDLSRLRYRLEKELHERRERRENKYRAEAQERDDMQQDRDEPRQEDRNQDRWEWNQVRKQDRNEGGQKKSDKQVLRSSVMRNLLRTYNKLNCEAKDECQDECGSSYSGKKKNNCDNRCEKQFSCEETEREDLCESGDCTASDEFGSTRVNRLVTVTKKCNLC